MKTDELNKFSLLTFLKKLRLWFRSSGMNFNVLFFGFWFRKLSISDNASLISTPISLMYALKNNFTSTSMLHNNNHPDVYYY